MSENYGPYSQMSTLAECMAACYQTDPNLELEPHVMHFMEEVEVNISASKFDHAVFVTKIRDRLELALPLPADPRRGEFLSAVVSELENRMKNEETTQAEVLKR